ncbi:MAG: hypothetical protein JNM31_13325 [Flavobacteriales bacterium]|nr:hypothetical protein [Flavobacteriales bacterium]
MRLLLPIILLSCATVDAQQLRVVPGTDDPMQLQFDAAFAQRNRVASVNGQLHVKRDREPMYPRKEFHLYRFDEQGRLIYRNTNHGEPGSGHDTIFTKYLFDTAGLERERRHRDAGGDFALVQEHDTQGRVVREVHQRLEDVDGLSRTEISDERFTYKVINDTVWMRTTLNNLGLPYREQRYTSDKLGYLRSIEDRYLISERRSRITFTYDEQGRLAERVEQPDLRNTATLTHRWSYDRVGNPTTRDMYRGDRHVTHQEFLYEEGTLFLKALLSKDVETGTIFVTKYTTTRL